MRTIGRIYAQTINKVDNVDAWRHVIGYLKIKDVVQLGYTNKTWMTIVEQIRREKFRHRRLLERQINDVDWTYEYLTNVENTGWRQMMFYTVRMTKAISGLSYVRETKFLMNEHIMGNLTELFDYFKASNCCQHSEWRNGEKIFCLNEFSDGRNVEKRLSKDVYEMKDYSKKSSWYDTHLTFDFPDEHCSKKIYEYCPKLNAEDQIWIYKKDNGNTLTIERHSNNSSIKYKQIPFTIQEFSNKNISLDVNWYETFDETFGFKIVQRVEKKYMTNSILGYSMVTEEIRKYKRGANKNDRYQYVIDGYVDPNDERDDTVVLLSLDINEFTMDKTLKKHKVIVYDGDKELKTKYKRKDLLRYEDWSKKMLLNVFRYIEVYGVSKLHKEHLVQIAEVNKDKIKDYEANPGPYIKRYNEMKERQARDREWNKEWKRQAGRRRIENEKVRKEKKEEKERIKAEKQSLKAEKKQNANDEQNVEEEQEQEEVIDTNDKDNRIIDIDEDKEDKSLYDGLVFNSIDDDDEYLLDEE